MKILLIILTVLLQTGSWAQAADMPMHEGADMSHRMMMLVIQLGLILFAARLGSMLAVRIRLPGVVGELLAGVVLGPYLLGGLSLPGFHNGLFPLGSSFPISPELYGICTLAVIVLLFMVGLETDIGLFMRYSLAASAVGVGGVIVSFIFGDALAVVFCRTVLGDPVGFLSPPCLFLGIITTATSVGITARILSEKRQLDSPEGITILGGAVIDDVLGIILLTIGLGIITASEGSGAIDWQHIGMIAVKAVGIWLLATALGLLASRKIGVLLKLFGDRSSIAVMALGLALILAGLFEEAGLAMIVGAYVMGLSLSKTDIKHVVREKLVPIHAFLVPVFFTVMGMLVDVRLLLSTRVLLFGLIYTVVAGLAKILGCGVPAFFCGFNVRGALRIGVGMLPRGEVTLIIAGIGLTAGLLTPELFGIVVLMLLATALAAPPLLVALFENPAPGLRRFRPEDRAEPLAFSFPSPQTTELLMTRLLRIFESEGFFVHRLGEAAYLYQLRKDDVVINLRHEGADILFEARKSEAPLINTAMYEVVADLERTIRALRQPVDRGALMRKVQEPTRGKPSSTALTAYLSTRTLVPRLKGTTREEVIDELLTVLDRRNLIRDVSEARRAVLSREESMSTGMQYGVAIPHGRTDAVDRLICAIGLKPGGVDFASIDGTQSRIIVLTLSPSTASAPHMQFMSMVSQVLDEEGRTTLLTCETPGEMYTVLTGRTRAPNRREATGKRRPWRRRLGGNAGHQTGLLDYLRPELIEPNLKGETAEAVIDELIELVRRNGRLQDTQAVHEAVMARERDMPTGMEHGVAIPHARTDRVNQLICAVGIQRDGVDFGAIDSQPSRIIVLTLCPKDASAPHVQLMAMLCRALDEEGRTRVLSATSKASLWQALKRTDPNES